MPLAKFIKIYRPAYFERVGLRYVNFISRDKLGLKNVMWKDLIAPAYIGPMTAGQALPKNARTSPA